MLQVFLANTEETFPLKAITLCLPTKGKNHGSAVGTLVERKSRYVFLTHLNNQTAEEMRLSFTRKLIDVPLELRQTLTYDQGKEMSQHKILTADLNISAYFCNLLRSSTYLYIRERHSPWQKGTIENTNGLIRQFLPKGSELSDASQADLDKIAYMLNTRPQNPLISKPQVRFTEMN